MPTAKQLVDRIFEGSRQDYSATARHLSKVAGRVEKERRNFSGDGGKLAKADAADLRSVSKHLHHGRANKARSKFQRMDTAAQDYAAIGMAGHKRDKGRVQRSLDIEFSR